MREALSVGCADLAGVDFAAGWQLLAMAALQARHTT